MTAAALLALAGCSMPTAGPTTSNAPSARVLGVLQLVTAEPLGAAQPRSDAEVWTPSFDDALSLMVPSEVMEVSDSVRAGRALAITVRTIGPDGCWSADSGSLVQAADTVTIRPYDRHSGAAACTAVVLVGGLEHRFVASFDEPGTAVIRVLGRRVYQDARDPGTPVMVERKVVVIP